MTLIGAKNNALSLCKVGSAIITNLDTVDADFFARMIFLLISRLGCDRKKFKPTK